ncbi:MAG TPA: hypothetical protein VHP36_10230 [Chitinispirillaceae bacterium]|nr:hypothetical protein [Chitinispirillaceae bacterium]
MSWLSVDVEADGPIPGDFSMVALGAVIIEPSLQKTFYARIHPISEKWLPDSLKICGFSREQTLLFENPPTVMRHFSQWLSREGGKHLFFVSDNAFDWQYVNWYFYHFLGANPFGHYSVNLLSLFLGLKKNMYSRFKHSRKIHRNHHPLIDAISNAKVMLHIKQLYNLKINW